MEAQGITKQYSFSSISFIPGSPIEQQRLYLSVVKVPSSGTKEIFLFYLRNHSGKLLGYFPAAMKERPEFLFHFCLYSFSLTCQVAMMVGDYHNKSDISVIAREKSAL